MKSLWAVAIALLFSVSNASAKYETCGTEVVLDCDNNTIEFKGDGVKNPSPLPKIDCGPSTKSTKGKIGNRGKGSGPIEGTDAIHMDPQPCDQCAMHLFPPAPKKPEPPVGNNNTAGCIHIGPEQLETLADCEGIDFDVIHSKTGASKGSESVNKAKGSNQ